MIGKVYGLKRLGSSWVIFAPSPPLETDESKAKINEQKSKSNGKPGEVKGKGKFEGNSQGLLDKEYDAEEVLNRTGKYDEKSPSNSSSNSPNSPNEQKEKTYTGSPQGKDFQIKDSSGNVEYERKDDKEIINNYKPINNNNPAKGKSTAGVIVN